jgi:hypothetical protein
MMTALLGNERADSDGVVDRHQRLVAGAELPVVLLAQVVRTQVGAGIDQVTESRRRCRRCPRPSAV